MGFTVLEVLSGCWSEARLQESKNVSEGLISGVWEGDHVIMVQSCSRGVGKSILKVEPTGLADGQNAKHYKQEKEREDTG